MDPIRRKLLKGVSAAGAVGVAAGAGLLLPQRVFAAWPGTAFSAGSVSDAIHALDAGSEAKASDAITIQAPPIAEVGGEVGVTISAHLPKVESISILVADNRTPLTSTFRLDDSLEPKLSTRIRMRKTSRVVALVKADGQLYRAERKIKVTKGGCGG